MKIRIDPAAESVLESLYVVYPTQSPKEIELINSLLYHLARGVSFRVGLDGRDLVITPLPF